MSFADALAKAGIHNASKQEVSQYLSTGYPVLDHRLSGSYHGGGFAAGRIIEIFGPSSAGKTAIATNVMANAQKAGGLAGFHDHENSFDIGLGVSFGLSDDPNNWVYQAPTTFERSIDLMRDTVLTARGMVFKDGDYKKTGAAYFPEDVPFVWVFDSLASMVPMSAGAKLANERNMNDNTALARATAAHFPALAVFATHTNTTLIFLNQIRTKIGVMYGDPTTSPGGNAPEFYASQRLKLGKSMIVDKANGNAKIGQSVGCEVIKNKVYRPFEKCTWDFLFQPDGTGKFDVVGGVIDELKSLGILNSSGAYIEWIDGKKYYKSQLLAHIEENELQGQLVDLLPR